MVKLAVHALKLQKIKLFHLINYAINLPKFISLNNKSKRTIIEKVGAFNKGDENKHLYDPKEVLPV